MTDANTRRAMQANRRTDTLPEIALRSALHRRGLRFRKDLRLPEIAGCPRPDIAFTRSKVAVFVDGCFWHSCPRHGRRPATNTDYWSPKLAGNVARDRSNDAALRHEGWTVVRVWEHENVGDAVARVVSALAAAGSGTGRECM
ncbi:very short patch repair endonuclease [Rhodococcus gannanensis]|uniref:Very short patch repair endonuclease n=1 Tax=Rhodococcus gannanensis TaxID=1960308 RepID=A0ABW4P1K6_9NOCA